MNFDYEVKDIDKIWIHGRLIVKGMGVYQKMIPWRNVSKSANETREATN
jgi:hypothetical protein